MDRQTRMAMAAIVAGLRRSGAIDDVAVATVAAELTKVVLETCEFGAREHEQLSALAADVASSCLSRALVD